MTFFPSTGGRRSTWPMRPSSPPWPTRRRRDAASSSWRRRNTASASETSRPWGHASFPLRPRRRMSGVNLDGREIRKGAADAIEAYVAERGGVFPPKSPFDRRTKSPRRAAHRWSLPTGPSALGVIRLSDVVKGGHPGALFRTAADGHPDRHDHRGQSAHGGGGRRRGGRGRFSGRRQRRRRS